MRRLFSGGPSISLSIRPAFAALTVLATLSLIACANGPKLKPLPLSNVGAPAQPTPPQPAPLANSDQPCDEPAGFRAAAQYNAAASADLAIAPFGRPESGWALYGSQIGEVIQTRCAADSPGFAEALSLWQAAHGLTADGAVTVKVFQVLKGVWQEHRPFVMLRVAKICPAGADEARLEPLKPDEILGDKVIFLRPAALAALRRMTAAARSEVSEARNDPDLLKAFSAYRSPTADDARCQREQNCQGVVRAQCSVHRTGLAVDVNVSFAPGFKADSTVDANRLYQSRTETYRWLVHNAARFGFVNYVFEPWHWEWTGEAP